MMTESILEKMAKGIWSVRENDWPSAGKWEDANPVIRDSVMDEAKAALMAIREPSQGTLEAGWDYTPNDWNGYEVQLKEPFSAMIDHILGGGE